METPAAKAPSRPCAARIRSVNPLGDIESSHREDKAATGQLPMAVWQNSYRAGAMDEKDEGTRTDDGRHGRAGRIAVAVVVVVACALAVGLGVWQSHRQDASDGYRIVDEGTVADEVPRDVAAPFAADAGGSYAREGAVARWRTAALCGGRVIYLNHDGGEVRSVGTDGTDDKAVELPETAPDGAEGIPTVDSMATDGSRVYLGYHYYVTTGGWECVASMEPDGSDFRVLMSVECEYGPDTHTYVTLVGDRLYADYSVFPDGGDAVPTRTAMDLDGSDQQEVSEARGTLDGAGACWYVESTGDEGVADVHRVPLDDPTGDKVVYSGDVEQTSDTTWAAAGGWYYRSSVGDGGIAQVTAYGEDGLVGTVAIDPHDLLGQDAELRRCRVLDIDVETGTVYLYMQYAVGEDSWCGALVSCNLDGSGMRLLHNYLDDSGEPELVRPDWGMGTEAGLLVEESEAQSSGDQSQNDSMVLYRPDEEPTVLGAVQFP